MMLHLFNRLKRNENGATAVEFALYSTVFFGMLFGGIYASLVGFSAASLQSATESAARCRAMGVVCTDPASTQNFAATRFHKVTTIAPTFVSDTVACGNRVRGNLNFTVFYILGRKTFQLTSAACFPAQTTTT